MVTTMELGCMDLTDLAKQIRESTKEIDPKDLAAQLDYLDFEQRAELIKAHYEPHRPAPTVRVRINVSTSVKGITTTDTTLEWFGDLRDYDDEKVLVLRENLSDRVDAAYPPPPLDEAKQPKPAKGPPVDPLDVPASAIGGKD